MAEFTPMGVEAIVKGLGKFSNDLSQMSKAMGGLAQTTDSMAQQFAKAGGELPVAEKEVRQFSKSGDIMTGMLRRVGEMTANFVTRLPGMAVELVKLGAAVERQSNALDSMAQAYGTTGDAITGAIQKASNFTVDSMTAMQAANRAMLLDVAKSPDEFERLTNVAVRLGRVMGLDATQSINDFVTASGRQSIMIADNLGLTIKVGEANEQYAKQLGVTTDSLTKAQQKQAFLNAMLEAGEAKISTLGEDTLDTAGKIEQLQAAVTDAKTGMASWIAELVSAAVNVDNLAVKIREFPGWLEAHSAAFGAAEAAWISGTNAITAFDATLAAVTGNIGNMEHETARLEAMNRDVAVAAFEATDAVGAWEQGISSAIIPTVQAGSAWESLGFAVEGATSRALDIQQATASVSMGMHEQALAAEAAAFGMEGLLPPSTAYAENLQSIIVNQTRLNERLFDISGPEIAKVAIGELNMLLQAGTLTADQYNIAVTQLQLTFGLTSESTIGFRESMTQLNENLISGQITAAQYDEALLLLTEDLPPTTRETEELSRAMEEATRDAEELTREADILSAMAGDTFVEAAGAATTETDIWSMALFEAADAAGADAQELALLAAGLGIYTDEQIEAALATVALSTTIDQLGMAIANGSMTTAEAIYQLRQQIDLMQFSIGVTDRNTGSVGRNTGAVRENTKERGKNAEKARKQREEERELEKQQRELERALAKTGDYFADVVSDMEMATEETDAWTLALFEAADAAGADAAELAMLAGALGLYTEEQLEAALAAAAMQEKLETLGKEIAAGLGIDQAMARFNAFREELGLIGAGTAEVAMDTVTGGQISAGAVSSTSPYFQIGPNSINGGMDQAVFEERVRQTVAGAIP